MNTTLRWIRFEAIMIALLPINGISASKFHSFKKNHIGKLENSF
jgi:hypothetical protein